MDAVQKANSGHPGMPMGMADIATILFKDILKFDSNDPNLDGVVDVLETVKESAEELSDNDELVTKVDELIQSNKALQDKINKDKGFFDKHGNMIIIGLIIFVGLAILGGLFMMSKSMKPVREIIVEAGRRATETVEEVTDGPLISEP